jgi:hypothetical protein
LEQRRASSNVLKSPSGDLGATQHDKNPVIPIAFPTQKINMIKLKEFQAQE